MNIKHIYKEINDIIDLQTENGEQLLAFDKLLELRQKLYDELQNGENNG